MIKLHNLNYKFLFKIQDHFVVNLEEIIYGNLFQNFNNLYYNIRDNYKSGFLNNMKSNALFNPHLYLIKYTFSLNKK